MPIGVSTSPAHPQASGLLVPEVWSGRILERFYAASVLEAITNTDYEGEISGMGDKVKIRTRPSITINPYLKGQDLAIQRPSTTIVELDIDKALYWNFLVEDVDRAQSDLAYMEDWTNGAAEEMNEDINEEVLANSFADFDADNQGSNAGTKSGLFDMGVTGTPRVVTKNNVIQIVGEMGAVLSEQDVPEQDRWITVPPWFVTMIFASEASNALIQGNDQSLYRKGHVGEISGFQIYKSNQLASAAEGTSTASYIPFGHRTAISFASQLVKSDVLQSERQFGVLARGLNVYGWNVNKPDAAGVGYFVPSFS